jgi:ParB family transcriptional regulator, chromosome partitioning protein
MAREAERLLEGTGWLPEPFHTVSLEATLAAASDDEVLPDFLAGDGDESAAAGTDADSHEIAAE